MIRCPSCGQEIGMSRRCRECLKHMVAEKSGGINMDGALEIVGRIGDWEDGDGKSAPEILKAKVRALGRLVRDAVEAKAPVTWGTAARAAFAVHYVISPVDWTPDFLPGIGWQDDETVVEIVIETDCREILDYCGRSGLPASTFGLPGPVQ